MSFATETAGNDIPDAHPSLDENASEDAPRRAGRPRGAKNKVSRSTLAALAEGGPAIARRMVRIALGRPVLGERTDDGKRKRLWPDLAQQQYAARIVLAKLVADLKFQELTGGLDNTESVTIEPDGASTRDLSKAILQILGRGVKEDGNASFAVAGPNETLLRVRDPDLARRVLPDSQNATSAFPEPSAVHNSPAPANEPVPAQESPAKLGDTFVVADGRAVIQFHDLLPDGREKWAIYDRSRMLHCYQMSRDAAEAWAKRKVEEGKLK